jgi:predicted DNA-binding transcriptional regulator AlpA
MMDTPLLRTPKAADLLGLSPATLAKWRVLGGGPPYKKLGRVVVYDLMELLTWAQERSRASTSDTENRKAQASQGSRRRYGASQR